MDFKLFLMTCAMLVRREIKKIFLGATAHDRNAEQPGKSRQERSEPLLSGLWSEKGGSGGGKVSFPW